MLGFTEADAVMKRFQEGTVRDQIPMNTVMLSFFQKSTKKWAGKALEFPVETSYNPNVTPFSDGGAIGTGGHTGTATSTMSPKHVKAAIEMSTGVMRLCQSDPGAYVNAVEFEMKKIRKAFFKELNRIIYGEGLGKLAVFIAQDNNSGLTKLYSNKWLTVGEKVKIVANDQGSLRTIGAPATTGTIHAVGNEAAGYVIGDSAPVIPAGCATLYDVDDINPAAAGSTAALDWIARLESYGTAGVPIPCYEPMGLMGICSSSLTLQGLNPANYPKWKGIVHGNFGVYRALSQALLMGLAQAIYRASGFFPDLCMADPAILREYFELHRPDIRQVPLKIHGGYQVLEVAFGGPKPLEFLMDVDCPFTKVLMVSTQADYIYEDRPPEFVDDDGRVWRPQVSAAGYLDRWIAWMRYIYQFGTEQRSANGVLEDIACGTV